VPPNKKNRIRELIQKYLDRTSTRSERNELVDLIKDTSDPAIADELWKEVWMNSTSYEEHDDVNWDSLDSLVRQSEKTPYQKLWQPVMRWAAVAAAMVIVFFVAGKWLGQKTDFIVYETNYGERMEIQLEDGTQVNLNAGSKLIWDKSWRVNGIRKIQLEGEAYFEVGKVIADFNKDLLGDETASPDPNVLMPFEVETSDVTIHVLGTSFNAAQRRGQTEVFLEEGIVELSLHRQESTAETDEIRQEDKDIEDTAIDQDEVKKTIEPDIIRMRPGEYVSFSSGENQLRQKSMENGERLYEWKEGVLSYQDESFGEMLKNLEDIYGLSFDIKDKVLAEKRINFNIPYEDWNTVKKMMEVMLSVKIRELDKNHYRIE